MSEAIEGYGNWQTTTILNGSLKCSKCFKVIVTFVGWYYVDDQTFEDIKQTISDHRKECEIP